MRWSLGLTLVGGAFAACSLVVDTDGLSSGSITVPDAGDPVDAGFDAPPVDTGADVDATVIDPVCPNGQGLLGGAPWPMFGGCPTHGAWSKFKGPETPVERWRFDVPGIAYPGVFVGPDDVTYWGTESDEQFFVKLTATGALAWSGDVAGNVTPLGALARDGSIVVSASSSITCLRPDGSRKWKYETNFVEADIGVAITPDDDILTGSQDGRVIMLRPDGSTRWTFNVDGGPVTTDPALALDGTIYMSAQNGKLYAITNGAQKWAITLTTADAGFDPRVGTAAIGHDGNVYVGTFDRKLLAVRPDSGIAWARDLEGRVASMPAFAPDGTVFVATANGRVHAFTPDGTEKWVYNLEEDSPDMTPLVDAAGVVYMGSYSSLHAIRPDGTRKWKYTIGGHPSGQPAIGAGGRMYIRATNAIGQQRGTVRAIGD